MRDGVIRRPTLIFYASGASERAVAIERGAAISPLQHRLNVPAAQQLEHHVGFGSIRYPGRKVA